MKHLGISGGGTKIGGLFGACEVLMQERGYKPDVISGISAGAILSVPLALGKFDAVRKLVLNYDLDTFFSKPPIKDDGSVRALNAIGQIISGKHYLGDQANLEDALAGVVSKKEFERYRNDDSLPQCIVGAVDFYTGSRLYVNLKEQSYELFLKLVNASASIPIFTKGVALSGSIRDFEGNTTSGKMLLYDGGVRDHIGSARILDSNTYGIQESWSVFSRPRDYRVLSDKFEPKSILDILARYVDINNVEISKNDEQEIDRISNERGIKQHPHVYLPRVMDHVYDISPENLQKVYEAGKQAARGGS